MNSPLKLLFIIGLIVITGTCFGQRPAKEKPIVHFAADIIKIDSILSNSSNGNIERTSNPPAHNFQLTEGNARFELRRGHCDRKGEIICPMITEMDRPKKI